ncbi:two-component system sensor histidine kinase YesM [Paenibacillus phyllosphaerae]|uniref:histidine kinase n=1 Tax=Paenibacillus phyllosphaerae TaxID=274593 RepID=A0A7W5FNT5_9BACL|nr:sensor histidine kinase [Paenibacillus phyllosphaerae]MBB3111492.1 two-component system sensor histidine kinase YesM [Paenibacillus phyllosphaerae]
MISRLTDKLAFGRLRLSTKLMVTYTLLTIIPMSLLGYFSYWQYTKSIEEQIGEYMPRFLVQADANIKKHMDELSTLPEMLFNSEAMVAILRRDVYQSRADLNRDQFEMNSFLNRTYLNGASPDVIGVFLLSKNRVFESTRLSYSGIDWGQAFTDYGQDLELRSSVKLLLPGDIGLRFVDNVPYVLIMKQIEDVDNRKNLGMMFIAVRLNFIRNVMHNLENSNQADMWLMTRKGQIIFHTNPQRIGAFDPNIDRYPLLDGSFREKSETGTRLVSVRKSDELDWVLVHSVPLEALTARTDFVKQVTILVFIGLVLLSIFMYALFSIRVTRPLNKLNQLMKHVEMGKFNVDLKVQSKDEIGTLAGSFNSMVTTIRELIEQNYHIEIRQKEAELYALQSQINPHFMYNTLETISMAVEEDEKETVVEMVTLLGRMLRFSVNNKSKFVTIDQEVQHVHDYLTIQKFRFEDRLSFDIAESLPSSSEEALYTPNFILQPIVENAIKYGLEARKGVDVRITVSEEFGAKSGRQDLVFRIRDNGPGIAAGRLEQLERAIREDAWAGKDSGFGLSNVNARIVLLHGHDYGIQLHSIEGIGTEIAVRIPITRAVDVERIEKEAKYRATHSNLNRR